MLASSLVGMLAACVFTNQNHCALNEGACEGELVCDRCAVANNGCVKADELTQESCKVENSDTATATTTTATGSTSGTTVVTEPTTTEAMTTTTTTASTVTEPTTTTSTSTGEFTCDPSEPVNPQCFQEDPEKPYCVAVDTCGSCSELKDVTCAEISGDTPACDSNHALCVECTADNTTNCNPGESCNVYINDCGPCFEHEQCPQSACNIVKGECFTQTPAWVQERSDCNENNEQFDGSEENPYCHLAHALNEEAKKSSDIVIWMKPGLDLIDTAQPLILSSGMNVAVIGKGETKPVPRVKKNNTDPRVVLVAQSALYMSNVELRDDGEFVADDSYIYCGGGAYLHLDKTRITALKNPMSTSEDGCEITLNRSSITNTSGGSQIKKSKLTMVNTFITSNNSGNIGSIFRLYSGTDVKLTNVTVIDNQGANNNSGFDCVPGIVTMEIRNSVMIGDLPPVAGCDIEMATGTFFEPSDGMLWTSLFQTPEMGIFYPKSGADELKIATWEVGDPYVDYDGKLRSTDLEVIDFAGAARP